MAFGWPVSIRTVVQAYYAAKNNAFVWLRGSEDVPVFWLPIRPVHCVCLEDVPVFRLPVWPVHCVCLPVMRYWNPPIAWTLPEGLDSSKKKTLVDFSRSQVSGHSGLG